MNLMILNMPDITTLIRKAREYVRKLWVRVTLMGFMAFVALGLTQIIEPLVPKDLATTLTGAAADRLLQIIANAMLAATIFSITVMVTVYRAASTQWTPRIHRLIIQDRTTMNTLAVFIGAYVYALLAIIMRELGIYVDERALALFGMTVLVLVVIVVYLIRWVLHLQTFGGLIDVTRQVEEVTTERFRERLSNPCLGANALTSYIPNVAKPVVADQSGYVQQIYPEALDKAARAWGYDVYLTADIGSFVFENEQIAMVVDKGDAEDADALADFDSFKEALCANIILGDVRTFDQDPRLGLITMSEVASKALSPGINDPGTAIDVIHRIGRILSNYQVEAAGDRDNLLVRLYVRPLDPGDLLKDALVSISRDGLGLVEVQQSLQKVLSGLRRHPDAELSKGARKLAEDVLERALRHIDFRQDRDLLRSVADADVLATVDARMQPHKDEPSAAPD